MEARQMNIEYIVIWRNLNNVATADEQLELNNWLASDEKHRLLYEHMIDRNEQDYVITENQIEQQWQRLLVRVEKKPRIGLKRWFQYAAAIVLPLIIATTVLFISDTEPTNETVTQQIRPGATKALLQLADGSFVSLDGESKQLIRNKDGDVIGSDSLDVLSYNANAVLEKIEYNTIRVPRGGEYNLKLADGTHVWLNAETELTYPINFIGDKREVKLIGEAYFDVVSNNEKPFIVQTIHSAVKVYGTQFNVMAYADETIEQMTLVEGSIAVLYENKKTIVKPGQQVQISEGSSSVSIYEVDTDLYTDWKNGIFRFENMPMDEVSRKLSRWYDVQFFFTNEDIKAKHITGAMKRNTEFSFFMELLEKSTEADITVNGKAVLIKGKY